MGDLPFRSPKDILSEVNGIEEEISKELEVLNKMMI